MNQALTTPKVEVVKNGRISKALRRPPPRNGVAYKACLVGGYRDTRMEIKRELLKRYGIDCSQHLGVEAYKDPKDPSIDERNEIVILLADDIKDHFLKRVLRVCNAHKLETIGIKRKSDRDWDATFRLNGFPNPPSWRDGFDIDKVMPEKLDHIEPPRLAYEDPDLKAMRLAKVAEIPSILELAQAGTLAALVAPKVEAKVETKTETPKTEPVAATSPSSPEKVDMTKTPKKRGTANPGTMSPSPAGFPSELRAAREAKGWSQGKLAEKLKITQAPVSAWERGNGLPSYEFGLKLAKLFPDLELPSELRGQKAYEKIHGSAAPAQLAKAAKMAQKVVAASAKKPEPVPAPVAPKKGRPLLTNGAGGLDEYMSLLGQLKNVNAALAELQELQDRRDAIIARIDELHPKVMGR